MVSKGQIVGIDWNRRVSSSSVVEHLTRSRRVMGSNPIWDSDFSEFVFLYVFRASGRSRKKKSNFAGFSGANSRKKRPISREFRGNF